MTINCAGTDFGAIMQAATAFQTLTTSTVAKLAVNDGIYVKHYTNGAAVTTGNAARIFIVKLDNTI